jgi:hypothetical protein
MKINKLYVEREETREQLREDAANPPFPSTNGIQLIHGDFNDKSKGFQTIQSIRCVISIL